MKKLIYWLIILILSSLLFGCLEQSEDDTPISRPVIWSITSPMGITIMADQLTIDQYNARWVGYHTWDDIDWVVLDEVFKNYSYYLCWVLGWDCKDIDTSYLTVHIQPWDPTCEDTETPDLPYEFRHPIVGCGEGVYWNQEISIHLGDDPGVDFEYKGSMYRAFRFSAYENELLHFFQHFAGLPYSDIVDQHSTLQVSIILPCECGGTEFEQLDETHYVCKVCGEIKEVK